MQTYLYIFLKKAFGRGIIKVDGAFDQCPTIVRNYNIVIIKSESETMTLDVT